MNPLQIISRLLNLSLFPLDANSTGHEGGEESRNVSRTKKRIEQNSCWITFLWCVPRNHDLLQGEEAFLGTHVHLLLWRPKISLTCCGLLSFFTKVHKISKLNSKSKQNEIFPWSRQHTFLFILIYSNSCVFQIRENHRNSCWITGIIGKKKTWAISLSS